MDRRRTGWQTHLASLHIAGVGNGGSGGTYAANLVNCCFYLPSTNDRYGLTNIRQPAQVRDKTDDDK